MNRLKKLIETYGLAEDEEYVIIPYVTATGENRRIHVLRRPYLIISKDAFHRATASIEDIVEAIVNNPTGSLWEELRLSEQEAETPEFEEAQEGDAPGEGKGADVSDNGGSRSRDGDIGDGHPAQA